MQLAPSALARRLLRKIIAAIGWETFSGTPGSPWGDVKGGKDLRLADNEERMDK